MGGIPCGRNSVGGILYGWKLMRRNPVWEESCLEESRVGGILFGGIPWEVSRVGGILRPPSYCRNKMFKNYKCSEWLFKHNVDLILLGCVMSFWRCWPNPVISSCNFLIANHGPGLQIYCNIIPRSRDHGDNYTTGAIMLSG